MRTSRQWQLGDGAAERYETILTPTILGPFARALVDFAVLRPSERVIDIGCGTGAAARYAAPKVGGRGSVLGIDINQGMIAMARSLPAVDGAAIEWRVARATELPVPDGKIDVALCAQTLQFLPEKHQALAEAHRVLRDGGRALVSLWCAIEENPYFEALVTAMRRHVGAEVAAGLEAIFALTDMDEVTAMLQKAGFGEIDHEVTRLDLPLPALRTFVPRHIGATPMAAGFEQAGVDRQQAVVTEVAERLSGFENGRGARIPFRSHMVGAWK